MLVKLMAVKLMPRETTKVMPSPGQARPPIMVVAVTSHRLALVALRPPMNTVITLSPALGPVVKPLTAVRKATVRSLAFRLKTQPLVKPSPQELKPVVRITITLMVVTMGRRQPVLPLMAVAVITNRP